MRQVRMPRSAARKRSSKSSCPGEVKRFTDERRLKRTDTGVAQHQAILGKTRLISSETLKEAERTEIDLNDVGNDTFTLKN